MPTTTKSIICAVRNATMLRTSTAEWNGSTSSTTTSLQSSTYSNRLLFNCIDDLMLLELSHLKFILTSLMFLGRWLILPIAPAAGWKRMKRTWSSFTARVSTLEHLKYLSTGLAMSAHGTYIYRYISAIGWNEIEWFLGGKGRTGTMICVWLVETGLFNNATDSLDYFGARRTDTRVGQTFQGVETPSQVRIITSIGQ